MKKTLKVSVAVMIATILVVCLLPASFGSLGQTEVQAATAKISATKLTVEKGDSKTLKVTGAKVKSWSSSKSSVASVSKGVVMGKKRGVCTITAKTSSKTLTCKVQVVPTEKQATKKILAMKKKYPEGKSWTSKNKYTFKHLKGQTLHVNECQAFAFMMSDAAYGSLPAYISYDFGKLKPGDVIFVLAGSTLSDGSSSSGSHALCVQSVDYDKDELICCEGNYGGKVHWDAKLTISEMATYAGQVIITRQLYQDGAKNAGFPSKPKPEKITGNKKKSDGYRYAYCKKVKCTGYQFLLAESSKFPWKETAVYYRGKDYNYLYGNFETNWYMKVRAFNIKGVKITYGKWSKAKKVIL